ncbi:ABC transporter permease [Mycetocola lacteus]|uniref:ABC transporter permease n=1 Tax=Mycetocola lacteus TaxID=76637 RepID=A0A3L7AM49_9MICO|nr:ABC transporter permease [Mycetocola lacteus]RLP84595.1 ABC transporter permease [Mycetocola lacteus]
MLGFLARRLGINTVLVVLATALSYVVASLVMDPGARFRLQTPPLGPDAIAAKLAAIGADPREPVLSRLGAWARGILWEGNLGRGLAGENITQEIAGRAGTSLRLLVIGSLLAAIVGIGLGVWGAVRQYRLSDQVVGILSYVVFATPTFVLAILLMIAATALNSALGFQFLEFTGEGGEAGQTGLALLGDRIGHLVLPTLVLVLIGAAGYSRVQRSAMLDVLSAEYIRTARAKGLRRTQAIWRHGVRVAIIPMSTFLAYSLGTLIAGSAAIEIVFSWNGVGRYLVSSIGQGDINAIAGGTAFVSVVLLIAASLSDVLFGLLDPRVRGAR